MMPYKMLSSRPAPLLRASCGVGLAQRGLPAARITEREGTARDVEDAPISQELAHISDPKLCGEHLVSSMMPGASVAKMDIPKKDI